MKAAVYERYGPPEVVELKEVPTPAPGDTEVLIRVHATTVTSADWRVRSLRMPRGFAGISRLVFGFTRPRQPVLGTEAAGEVVAIGKDVTRFKVGDAVFAFSGARMGCHAEFKCMAQDGAVALKPEALSFEQAAALPFGATTALTFLRRAKLQPGDRVLVNGASGSVGTAAVQLARHFGADVTAVCSGANLELVRSLGASRGIDYTREDFAASGARYDVIVDTVGTAPYSRARHALKDGGRLLAVLAELPDMLAVPWVALTTRHTVISGPAPERAEDLRFIADLAQTGKFKPVIDRVYAFERIVDAHRHVDTGRKRGNVVVTLAADAGA
jgi:NADPH:quinone reductase-like Zn-dependent oxidoreductase